MPALYLNRTTRTTGDKITLTSMAKSRTKTTRNKSTTNNMQNTNTLNKDTRWRRQNIMHSNKSRTTLILSRTIVICSMLLTVGSQTVTATTTTTDTSTVAKYSQPFAMDDDGFRPMIPQDINPEYITRNIFTETGQYRVFEPVETDLRAATTMANRQQRLHRRQQLQANEHSWSLQEQAAKRFNNEPNEKSTKEQRTEQLEEKLQHEVAAEAEAQSLPQQHTHQHPHHHHEHKHHLHPKTELNTELKSLEELLIEYVENFFTKGQYEPVPGLVLELQKNHTIQMPLHATIKEEESSANLVRQLRQAVWTEIPPSGVSSKNANEGPTVRVDIPRALQTGRLLFFTGLKKLMWPVFVGLQILKSLLFAMFLPSLIGSFGKLLGKGIASASIRPMEAPQDLDFRDNSFNFDEENNKFIINDDGGKDGASYAYNQPEASQTHYTTYNAGQINNQALSRYGVNEKQSYKMPDSYLSALQTIGSASFKNSNSISGGSSQGSGGGGMAALAATNAMRPKPAAASVNNFQKFQKVPASSLLLSNYDPFYSPLLSRLDSVFAQLKLNSESEECREKLICLMYANPAKYAPYSNLVSAQLSRELNELRKPTSDNPDILRFFKYMRAAKDGQDGIDCEESFGSCKEFKDFENPAMVSTYHDINKLVQARKLT